MRFITRHSLPENLKFLKKQQLLKNTPEISSHVEFFTLILHAAVVFDYL